MYYYSLLSCDVTELYDKFPSWSLTCVVNSRIGLWVGVCIEGSKVIVVPWVSSCMGFVPEGSSMSVGVCIEGSKVIVVPWVSSCMGFVPEGSSMSSRGYKSHTP